MRSVLEETVKNEFKPCGAVACAIGWMPACFPGEFVWDSHGHVRLIKKGLYSFVAAQDFFEIKFSESDQLFTEIGYDNDYPKPKDVAAKIRGFVNEQNSL